jgi:hypothetical protein
MLVIEFLQLFSDGTFIYRYAFCFFNTFTDGSDIGYR